MAGDPTAQMALLLEEMFKSGSMTPEMKETARKIGVDMKAMEVDSDGSVRFKKHKM